VTRSTGTIQSNIEKSLKRREVVQYMGKEYNRDVRIGIMNRANTVKMSQMFSNCHCVFVLNNLAFVIIGIGIMDRVETTPPAKLGTSE
jgi:hypothetical protein